MIKKIFLFIILVVLAVGIGLFLTQSARNNPIAVIRKLNLDKRTQLKGYPITFRILYMGFVPVGEASVRNLGVERYKEKDAYHVSVDGKTTGFVTPLFNAAFVADSWIDKEKIHTLKFSQTLLRPDKPKDIKEVFYDQVNNVMEHKGVKRQILPDTQDPLSVMFFISRQKLALGKEFDININTNQKNYRLVLKVVKKEEYATDIGKTGVWVVEGDVKRRDKSSRHSSTMTLWLMDNSSNTPLLARVMTNGGLIVARLMNIE